MNEITNAFLASELSYRSERIMGTMARTRRHAHHRGSRRHREARAESATPTTGQTTGQSTAPRAPLAPRPAPQL